MNANMYKIHFEDDDGNKGYTCVISFSLWSALKSYNALEFSTPVCWVHKVETIENNVLVDRHLLKDFEADEPA